jgi:hypothetical protein
MRGSPWIEEKASLAGSAQAAAVIKALLASVAIGAVVTVVTDQVRLHLGLPGHRAILWMAPLVIARVVLGRPLCATASALAAGLTSLATGGHFVGAAVHLPMAAVAGAVLDVAVSLAERWRLSAVWAIPLVGLAGLVANLVMLVERLMGPLFQWHSFLGATGVDARFISHAVFGLAAGLLGAALGYAVTRRRVRRGSGQRA